MTENMCKRPPVHRKTEESGHRMPAENFLFPQRMVRAYNSPKPGGYLGNVDFIASALRLGVNRREEKHPCVCSFNS